MNAKVIDGFSNADWNLYATCYDALLQLQPYQELLSTVANALNPEENDCILDAGCGTGNLLYRLSLLKENVQFFGADLSLEMLTRASSKCAGFGVDLTRTSLNEILPYNDASFTKVSSVNVLYAVADPSFTLRELWRISKPNATLVLVTPRKEYDNGLVLKAHAMSNEDDAYWKDLHASTEREERLVREAVKDDNIVEMMLLVARYNRFISKTATFHFLTEGEFTALVSQSGFAVTSLQSVYADQCMMVIAQKGV
jgi:ubiquinone/menaquinone biosynthesis C-methylase UbiE